MLELYALVRAEYLGQSIEDIVTKNTKTRRRRKKERNNPLTCSFRCLLQKYCSSAAIR